MASKILVGFDGTDLAQRALDLAVRMAKAFNADLFLFTSVPHRKEEKEKFEFIL
jgi:nucleotide-binding universal stress UspA family protein